MSIRSVAVLGATGSIGRATLDVIAQLGPLWRVGAVSAHNSVDQLRAIVDEVHPRHIVLSGDSNSSSEKRSSEGATTWPAGSEVCYGPEGLVAAATSAEIDTVVAAIVGRAGVESTIAALQAGKRVALANKETLVCAGPIVADLLAPPPATLPTGVTAPVAETGQIEPPLASDKLLPVDSEHSAIFQCIQGDVARPKKLILTASGGPFRTWTTKQMHDATVDQALHHPTWKMGKKITIDSASMMNKALELVEARWLFGIPADHLEVVIHPQSIIHSLVEFLDGSVVAQMSLPDMRLPIQYALTYPERLSCPAPSLNRTKSWELTLEPVDQERFPAVALGFEVAAAGGTAGAVINAANEEAVDLFLHEQIRFTDIVPACRAVLDHHTFEARPTLDRLLELDRWARAEVRRWSCLSTG